MPQRKGQNPGTGAGRAEGSRGRSSPPGPSRPLQARRGGRRSGDGDGRGAGAGGRAVARREARAQRTWVANGCWCWSVGRESPPSWRPAPSHTWPVSSQGGVRPPRLPVLRGCHGRAPAAPPHLGPPVRGSALRHRGLSNTRRGGVPETRTPRARGPREGRTNARAAALRTLAAVAGKRGPGFFRILRPPGRK